MNVTKISYYRKKCVHVHLCKVQLIRIVCSSVSTNFTCVCLCFLSQIHLALFKTCTIVFLVPSDVCATFPDLSDCLAVVSWSIKHYCMYKYVKFKYVNILSCALLVGLPVKRLIKQREREWKEPDSSAEEHVRLPLQTISSRSFHNSTQH